MHKYIYALFYIFLVPHILLAQMQCGEGKCAASMEKSIPKVEKKRKNTRPTITQLFNVNTVQVKKQTSSQKEMNYGYIVAKDSLKVDVVAWYSGFVKVLYANTLYTYVKKGDALAKVYSPEVYKAKEDYLNSLNYSSSNMSVGMLKSAKRKLSLLGIDPREIQHIQDTRKADEFTTIYAPSSGWVFAKKINQGSAFSMKQKLFEIVNLKEVWLEVKLFQEQLATLEDFPNYSVTVKGVQAIYPAKKSLVYPILDPKEATFTLRLEIDNAKGILKTGMYATVERTSKSKEALVIPRTAVIRKGSKWYAFLSTEFKGEYEPIEIHIKALDKNTYEVTKGLTSDDTVVNNALFMMDSNAQINAIY